MRIHRLERSQTVGAAPEEVFEFFSAARNLERLTPAWLSFEVRTPEPIELREGTLIDYGLRLHGLPLRWRTRIERWQPGRAFVDRQLRGPYRLWHHRHEFEPVAGGTQMRDLVHYALPLGPLGQAAHALLVRRDIEHIFDFRHATIAELYGEERG